MWTALTLLSSLLFYTCSRGGGRLMLLKHRKAQVLLLNVRENLSQVVPGLNNKPLSFSPFPFLLLLVSPQCAFILKIREVYF